MHANSTLRFYFENSPKEFSKIFPKNYSQAVGVRVKVYRSLTRSGRVDTLARPRWRQLGAAVATAAASLIDIRHTFYTVAWKCGELELLPALIRPTRNQMSKKVG